jgi:hypothetical protein
VINDQEDHQPMHPGSSALPASIVDELALLPETDWQPTYDADGRLRPGAWVLEVTGLLNLSGWQRGPRCCR